MTDKRVICIKADLTVCQVGPRYRNAMEQRPYTIEADAARYLMTIRFSTVFWDAAIAERFRSECLAVAPALRCPPGEHVVLVDLRNAVLQSQETIDRMKSLIGIATARRIALVAGTPLARMQTKRLQLRENVVLFDTIEDARAWLFAADARAAA